MNKLANYLLVTAMVAIGGCSVSLDDVCPLCELEYGTAPLVVQASAPAPAPAPDPCRERVRLYGVNFDFDRATLRPEGRRVLDGLVASLRRCPATRIRVEGHTDSIGTEQYNRVLSAKRAAAVVDYLVVQGLERAMLSSRGAGETEPIADNMYEAGRAKNRRVEVRPLD